MIDNKTIFDRKQEIEEYIKELNKKADELLKTNNTEDLLKILNEQKNANEKLKETIETIININEAIINHQEPVKIKIINNIETKVNEYIQKTGTSKVWIAMKMGMSKQALYGLFKSTKPSIDNLEKMAYILGCKVDELYSTIILE